MTVAAANPATTSSTSSNSSHRMSSSDSLQTSHAEPSEAMHHITSSESRSLDLRNPIPEEEEEEDEDEDVGEGELEDETSSEAANEPVTPTDSHHNIPSHAYLSGISQSVKSETPHEHGHTAVEAETPFVRSTAPTQPPASTKAVTNRESQPPKTPNAAASVQKRPTLSTSASKEGGIKRAMSGLFKRTQSQNTNPKQPPSTPSEASDHNGSDARQSKEYPRLSMRRMSATSSQTTTRSSTPPSPGSPSDATPKARRPLQLQEASPHEFLSHNNRKKNRSSTNFNLFDKLPWNKNSAAPPASEPGSESKDQDALRHRSSSVDLENLQNACANCTDDRAQLPSRQIWGMAADSGTGLKARRLSLSLPDDFLVDVIELYKEYCDQSKLIGRRGKHVGKGATANVKLMQRKGGCAGEVYAVKEFRGKSSVEKSDDYEKKVKSEFSIAKSLHHPNIVETFRLCTHNGRWNHVMEFCDQGDLFSLVSQKYLSKADHQVDRLCLFKQLVQGLNYLHHNGIAHRDVKLENLLITKDSKLKITDFGVSEVFAGIHPGLRSAGGQCGKDMGEIRLCAPGMCGSPPYVAPEVIAKRGEYYDPRPLDVWGAAIVMLCMAANGVLWNEATPGSSPLYDDLVRGWTKWYAKHTDIDGAVISETDYPHVKFFDEHINPPALRRILLTMLNPSPAKRVSMEIVANNRWLKKVECCQPDSYEDPTHPIDAAEAKTLCKPLTKLVRHNHLPPSTHLGHKLVRLPGSTDM